MVTDKIGGVPIGGGPGFVQSFARMVARWTRNFFPIGITSIDKGVGRGPKGTRAHLMSPMRLTWRPSSFILLLPPSAPAWHQWPQNQINMALCDRDRLARDRVHRGRKSSGRPETICQRKQVFVS